MPKYEIEHEAGFGGGKNKIVIECDEKDAPEGAVLVTDQAEEPKKKNK